MTRANVRRIHDRLRRGLVIGVALAAMGTLLPSRAAHGDAWDVAAALFGIDAGTSAASSPDPLAVAEPQLLSDTEADAAIAVRMERLRERHDSWRDSRPPVVYEPIERPAGEHIPPLPDAPDGEITQQHEAGLPE